MLCGTTNPGISAGTRADRFISEQFSGSVCYGLSDSFNSSQDRFVFHRLWVNYLNENLFKV